jgi:hypothetical protein
MIGRGVNTGSTAQSLAENGTSDNNFCYAGSAGTPLPGSTGMPAAPAVCGIGLGIDTGSAAVGLAGAACNRAGTPGTDLPCRTNMVAQTAVRGI